jgi:hypothetical protein
LNTFIDTSYNRNTTVAFSILYIECYFVLYICIFTDQIDDIIFALSKWKIF